MQPQVAEAQMAALSHCLTVLMLTNGADVLRKKAQRMKFWSSFIFTCTTISMGNLNGAFHCERGTISVWSNFFACKSVGSG